MHFIFDHINSFIIVSVILLVLMMLQMRTLENSIEDTSIYTAKTDALDLAEMLEADLTRSLYRVDQDVAPFVWYPDTLDGRTTRVEFYSDSLNGTGVLVPRQTRYDLQFIDSLATPAGRVARFELVRSVCESTPPVTCTWDYAGSSAPWVIDFDAIPKQADRSDAVTIGDSHYMEISFLLSPPYQTQQQVVDKMHWSALMPVRLF